MPRVLPRGGPEYETLISGDRGELLAMQARVQALRPESGTSYVMALTSADRSLLWAVLVHMLYAFTFEWRRALSEKIADGVFERLKALRP